MKHFETQYLSLIFKVSFHITIQKGAINMFRCKKSWNKIIFLCLLCFSIYYVLSFSNIIYNEMNTAITRCLTVIFPSLYAMMIISEIVIRTGSWQLFGKPFRYTARKWFKIPESYYALFLFSQIAGYPVGANMLTKLVATEKISKYDAEKMLCICYGGGPAFLLGILNSDSSNRYIYLVIFFSQIISNHILCLILFHKFPFQSFSQVYHSPAFSANIFISSVVSAGTSLLKLCAVILSFSVICTIPDAFGWDNYIDHVSLTILKSLLEVSNSVYITLPAPIRYVVLSGVLSFGGCCVLLQIRSVVGNTIRIHYFLISRIAALFLSSCLSALFFWLYFPYPQNAQLPAMAPAISVSKGSIVSSIMLIIMILLLLHESQKGKK